VITRTHWLVLIAALAAVQLPAADLLRAQEEPTAAEAKAEGEKHAEPDHSKAGGHAHDDTDLSHANASDELNEPSQVRFELAVATFVVFLLLVGLLGKFAWGPISQGLDKREQHIATMIADAERNAHESEQRLRELEARLAAQAEEARQALSAARREGEIVKEKLVGEAQAAAQAEKDRALDDIRAAKNAALREIAQKSVNTAVDLAKNLIHREVNAGDHAQLIKDSLAQFGNN
jgi:F-type H+-transporting ATPase subunit b